MIRKVETKTNRGKGKSISPYHERNEVRSNPSNTVPGGISVLKNIPFST